MDQIDGSNIESCTNISEQWLPLVLRHIVSLSLVLKFAAIPRKRPEGKGVFSFTAFVVEMADEWWLVTAGHVARNIQEACQDESVKLISSRLVDNLLSDSPFREPIPFDLFDQPLRIGIDDDEVHLDFHLTHLRANYRQLLEANGIMALPVDWERGTDYSGFDVFAVVGFPKEFFQEGIVGQRVNVTMDVTLVPIKPLDYESDVGTFDRFVGEILDMGKQSSIKGMSGGPIFGLRRNGLECSYEVVAIQSTWKEQDKLIFGCPLSVAKCMIDEALEEHGRECASNTT